MIRQVRALPTLALLLAGVTLSAPAPAAAQRLTVERIFGSSDFSVRGFGPVRWTADGQRLTWLRPGTEGAPPDIVAQEAGGGTVVLARGQTLVATEGGEPITVESYAWSRNGRRALLYANSERVWRRNTLGEYFVWDVASGKLTPVDVAGKQMFAKLSPDGARVAYVRDNDLWLLDLASGRHTRLTSDGSATIINGTTDWVYEEEFDLRDAWRWSPDGRRIAFWRFDQSPIQPFPLLDYAQLYEGLQELRYPKAGTPNSHVRLGVIQLATGKTTWIDPGDGDWEYLPRMDWAASSDRIVFQRLPRLQNRIDVMLADASTGKSRVLFTETDSAWVDVDDDLTFVDDGRRFLWSSERDGWNHLWIYDRDGGLARLLTPGDYDVTALDGVDDDSGWVYFTAAERSPIDRQLYRVRLDGSGMQRVSRDPGTHSISMAPGAKMYIDAFSTAGDPPVVSLHRADGTLVRVLQDNAAVRARLAEQNLRAPDFFDFETADGVRLNGWMIKPPDFDAHRRYPLLLYVYGGPGSQTVTDGWGGDRYLWHQLLAQRGYIVASVDNRGTGARGAPFRKQVYRRLGTLETHDQIEAARYLGSLPYVDSARIGIWGWSYGGYMTALTMERGGNVFRAGISVAPVTDWRLYDTVYTERYMQTPQLNPDGYADSAPVDHASGLTGELLLVHGTGDDNVHFQNSVRLVDALEAADRQFAFMIYPNRTHSITGGNARVHLFTMMTDWIVGHL